MIKFTEGYIPDHDQIVKTLNHALADVIEWSGETNERRIALVQDDLDTLAWLIARELTNG